MAIPKEILAVKRPSSTVVKQRGDRFVVIKRTSRRDGNRVVPVDLGTVGEIINGVFVEQQIKSDTKKRVDIKDYGEVTLCDKFGKDLIQQLARVWSVDDAKRIYVISLLRAAYGAAALSDILRIRVLSRRSPVGACRFRIPHGVGTGILAHLRVHAQQGEGLHRR